jgi:uncharacterized protein (TIGR02231 family)
MKKLLLWAAFIGGATLTQAAMISTTSQISEVMVYPDRARVTRMAEVKLAPGENVIEVVGLPLRLDDNSLRVAGEMAAGVKLESLELRPVAPQAMEVDVAPLEKEIEIMQDKMRIAQDEKQEVERRRSYLDILKGRMSDAVLRGTNAVPVGNIKSYYELYGKESADLTTRGRQLELDERGLQRQVAKKQEELRKKQQGQPVTTKKALVVLSSEQARTVKLKLSYVMAGASWQPLYDARSEVGSADLKLHYYGNVAQQTGENWDNVKLTLCTARPSVAGRMPDFNPWVVQVARREGMDQKDAESKASNVPQAQLAAQMFNSQLNSPREVGSFSASGVTNLEDESLVMATAQVESLGTSAVFKVPASANIPSDGQAHRSTIGILSLRGEPSWIATPKLAAGAFLKTKVKNNSDLPLLPGEVSLFLGDDFLGKSFLRLVAPTAGFDLFLGVDDGVKITRKETKRTTEEIGLISRRQSQVRGYEIEVQNYKNTTAKVTVLEPLPVSQQSTIDVKPRWLSGEPAKFDKDQGKAEWTVELKPQEKKIIRYEFAVESEPGIVLANF